MGRILDIRWFQPSKNYSNKELQTFVNKITKAFKIRDLEALTTTDVDAAEDAAEDAALDAALDAARNAALDAAWGVAQGVALSAAWDAALGAALSAAWGAEYIIVQDLIEKKYPENPFGKLISVYELGLWPAGISKDKFLIWHPKAVDNN
jgi:hypothetical protein